MPLPSHGARLSLSLILAAGTALALAACSSSSGGSPSTSASAPASSASTSASASAAPSASAAAAVATCSGGQNQTNTFALGTFLPLTGSLKSLGPAAVAGAGLALSDIAAAGGVNGKAPCVISVDSSDKTQPTIGSANVKKLLSDKVSAILGAESSSVTENVLTTIVAPQNTVMFSPANTDDALTGISKWYFRDAPPNSVEGNALGKQIVSDGNTKVGFLVFNDSYGTNLRDAIEKSVVGAGGSVTYGGTGKHQEFPEGSTNFTSEVSSILATKPDAIVIDAFNETYQILPALKSAGWDMSKTYFVDGNLADYDNDANGKPTTAEPDLTGAKGSTQGVNPTPDLIAKLQAWYTKNESGTLSSYGYAAESYDAVVIMALAADVAGNNTSAGIQANILPVTGTTNGTVCTTYAACLADITGGNKKIHYEGPSGIGPLNSGHDPSTGFISIYQYVGKNYSKFLTSVKG